MEIQSVLLDHQAFEMQKYGGISRYFYELMKHLPVKTQLSLGLFTNYYLHSDPACHRSGLYLPERPYKWFKGPVKRWNRFLSTQALQRGDFTLFHPTCYNPYFLPYLNGIPYVITVHDMNHELFPHYFGNAEQMIAWKQKTILQADRVIAISEQTKRDILRFLPVDPMRIDVVYHGISQQKREYRGLKLPDRYLLYVGDRGGYKNFNRFLKVFLKLSVLCPDLYLVCTGKSFKSYEYSFIDELDLSSRVLLVKADDRELAQLYQQALLFVYPSLYEGFGIPILEAYLNDCPVALSDASCFPEVAGEAGAFFDPEEEESIFETLRKLLSDEEWRRDLVRKGKERLPLFTWEQTARKTAEVYARL